MRTASITINTSALNHNLQLVKKYAPNSQVLAMVKADAYGHGMTNCLPALDDADGVGVAFFAEAKQARLEGWNKAIVIIEGAFSENEWKESLAHGCQNVIHSREQLQWALAHLPTETSPSRNVWLKLNTGMNRLGFEPDEIVAIAQQLVNAGYHLVLTSHFANADVKEHPLNVQQIATFTGILNKLRTEVDPATKASLCNSAGLINFPDCHFDWVRPGIMLYGSSPFTDISAHSLNLQAVMHFQTALMAVHRLDAGVSVGYGSRYVTKAPLTKGIISIGYGDGYPRAVDDTAWVAIHQDDKCYKCPIIGRVAMDMIAIDLSEVSNASVNSRVTLWGDAEKGEPSVDEIASSANTLGYELLCRVTTRPITRVI